MRAPGGFSLIELLISLVVGLAIMAALNQMFVSSQRAYSLQDRMGVLQENGRYALYFLQRDIRNAGLPKDDKWLLPFDSSSSTPGTGGTFDGGGNAPDQIAVRYHAKVAGTRDCLGNNIAVDAVVQTVYSVNTDSATGISRLRCSAQGAAPQPIVDGIENMQVQYGVDQDSDGYADTYVTASSVSGPQWQQQVVAVRVAVLASSVNPVTGDTAQDNTSNFTLLDAPPVTALKKNFPFPNGPLKGVRGRVYTTTIEIRNRTSG